MNHLHTEQWDLWFPSPVATAGRTLERHLLPWAYRRDLVVAVSPSTARALVDIGVAPERIAVVPNGVDLPARPAPEDPEPLFLALGRLVPHKRHELLLRLWERVRPHTGGRLVIAGAGPGLPRLRETAGAGVEVRGRVDDDEKADLLARAWALLHPSVVEGWGLAVMEAAAHGTPALAFDAPGVRDSIVSGETGILADDEDGFVDAWIRLGTDGPERRRLGVAARQRAGAYPWSRTVTAFEAVAEAAVARERGGVLDDLRSIPAYEGWRPSVTDTAMARLGRALEPSGRRPVDPRGRRELFRLFLAEKRDPEPFYRALAERSIDELAHPLPGRRILDLGCGPGAYTRALARRRGPGRRRRPVRRRLRARRRSAAARGPGRRRLAPLPGPGLRRGVLLEPARAHPDAGADLRRAGPGPRPRRVGLGVLDQLVLALGRPRDRSAAPARAPGRPGHLASAVRRAPQERPVRGALAHPHRPDVAPGPRPPRAPPGGCRPPVLPLAAVDHEGARPPRGGDLELRAPPGAGAPGVNRVEAVGRRAVRRAHRRLGDHPLFLPVVLRLTPLGTSRALTDDTDLVVEGFPRSGNTWTVTAIRLAQGREVVIRSHVHVPAQVIAAVRRGLPTMVLVRSPATNAASSVVAVPHLDVERALRDWIDYHRRLLPHRDGFVAVDFATAVGRLSEAVDRVNERFGTAFSAIEDSPEFRKAVIDRMVVEHERQHRGAAHLAHLARARPHPSRATAPGRGAPTTGRRGADRQGRGSEGAPGRPLARRGRRRGRGAAPRVHPGSASRGSGPSGPPRWCWLRRSTRPAAAGRVRRR